MLVVVTPMSYVIHAYLCKKKKLKIYFKSRFGESAVTRLSNRLQKIDSSRLPHIYG